MKKLPFILFLFIFLNCKEKAKDIYHEYNGELVKVELLDAQTGASFTGFGAETYPNGKLKSLAYMKDGQIADTLFIYYENGEIKEKGLVKDTVNYGWWYFYDPQGRLKEKSEFVIVRDSTYKNQSYYYDTSGNLKIEPSTFFEIEISDTLRIGKNAARIKNYVTNFHNRERNYLSVIIENEYQDGEIKRDTFSDGTLQPYFGVSIFKTGKQIIKGKIQEKILTKTKDSTDWYSVSMGDHYKYFEKEVYVWEKDKETELGKKLRDEMINDYKNN